MIYLIGGSPRAGKSTISRKLSKKLNIPYISIDNIRPIVMPYFNSKDREKNFPFVKMYDSGNIDNFFKNYSGKVQLQADIKEAETIWPGVKSLINHLLICKMDYIIEGTQLLPIFVKQFKKNKHIKSVFLVKTDKEKIYQGLLKNINNKNHDWLVHNTKDKKTIITAADVLCGYGKFFIKETEKYGFKCINSESNFSKTINQTLNFLTRS